MLQKNIYDKICDVFDEIFKKEKKKESKYFRQPQCKKTPYHIAL